MGGTCVFVATATGAVAGRGAPPMSLLLATAGATNAGMVGVAEADEALLESGLHRRALDCGGGGGPASAADGNCTDARRLPLMDERI